MILNQLLKKQLIHPPDWLVDNTMYLTMMGSNAYGVTSQNSDLDIYGWCIPRKDMVFPHLKNEILGFGQQTQRFEQYQQHHIKVDETNYDITIYSIVKYFQLLMENNPNVIDSIWTPHTCVLHSTQISELVRNHRQIFLHKGLYWKYKGYAYSQAHKIRTKNPEGKRKELIEKYGYDTKYAYQLIRLLNEAKQLLATGDMDLQLNNEQLKAIRRGDVKENEIFELMDRENRVLDELYLTSKLPYSPDEDKIKNLLLKVLENHYGSLKDCIVPLNQFEKAIYDIKNVLTNYNL